VIIIYYTLKLETEQNELKVKSANKWRKGYDVSF